MQTADTTYCFRCHYDLRGIADDQACPECGLLAGRSRDRQSSDALLAARPNWLRGLSIGMWLLIAAMVLSIVAPWLGEALYDYLLRRFPSQTYFISGGGIRPSGPPPAFDVERWGLVIYGVGWELAAILLIVGVYLLTRPEGFEPADRLDRKRRILIRLAALIPIVALLYTAWLDNERFKFLVRAYFARWDTLAVGLLTLGCVPLPALGFAQLKSLAKRAGSRQLSEHCSIVGIGTSGTLLLVFGFFEMQRTMLAGDPNWASRSTAAMVLYLLLVTAVGLFVPWCFYLMIRFAVSFGRASRESRRAWVAADRSNASG